MEFVIVVSHLLLTFKVRVSESGGCKYMSIIVNAMKYIFKYQLSL